MPAADALAALLVVHHQLLEPDAQAAGLVRPGECEQAVRSGRAVVVLSDQTVRVGRAVHEQLKRALGVLLRDFMVAGRGTVEGMAAVDENSRSAFSIERMRMGGSSQIWSSAC
ncbi:MAG: hypothetical protein ACLR4Z_00880 [Butyricicoccaceae bacterium]